MNSRSCLAIVFILLHVVSLQSQTEPIPRSPLDKPEVVEAASLAGEVVRLYKQGKYKEALPLAKRCLLIREKAFTPADEALRTAYTNLAEVYMALRKYKDAEPLFQRLIKSYEEFAPSDARLVGTFQRMALIKFFTGEHDKTEGLYRRALEMIEKTSAVDDPMVASAASYLAEYYQAVGDLKKAEPLYQRIFAIAEKHTPTGDSEDFRQARDRYACLLYKTGREEQARELEKRPLVPGPKFTPVAGSVINGKAISLPKPTYPDEAKRAHVSGTVFVRIVIDEKGKVTRACAIKGPSLLMRAAEVAANNGQFSPTKLNGQPVKVTGVITYNFVAQ
jgi:TonB family protein